MPTPEIRFKRLKRDHDYATTRYEVHADGKLIGQVYTAEVAHDRKPRGSRIVTSRTYSDRWFVESADRHRVSYIWYDTRREAARQLLEHALELSAWDARKLAETARNYRKGEEV